MTTDHHTVHLYSDYAWLWPLWGNVDNEYAQWCALVHHVMQRHARRELHTLLNLGCGGGKNMANLKQHYTVTGVDISSAMLDLARQLNPTCTFVEADMRTCHLAQSFDAILIDDAITYMTSRADLTRVFRTASDHLAPGGVMVVTPDHLVETFQQNDTHVSHASASHKPAHLDVVFVENYYDPDPHDDTFESTFLYLIREHGILRVVQDHSTLGLFTAAVWREALQECGFVVHEEVGMVHPEHPVFVCVKE
ncbi:MAG: class I SAM-dependent DNA methyltransferase [Roseiflexaceae bacterium]|jgi:predicted TPR repeat methyltransferase|nr:class I SAM-dependent methyltransferase [Chloroflexaceae bacterium]